jgi:hypothetical protein
MHVCYVCMYVCMYVRTSVYMHVRMHIYYVCIMYVYVYTHACILRIMFVYMYICSYFFLRFIYIGRLGIIGREYRNKRYSTISGFFPP